MRYVQTDDDKRHEILRTHSGDCMDCGSGRTEYITKSGQFTDGCKCPGYSKDFDKIGYKK